LRSSVLEVLWSCGIMLTLPVRTSLMSHLNLPNLLSASRLVMAVLMIWLVAESEWLIAAALIWLAVATDVLDGFLARRLGSSSSMGGVLDHGSDALFVTAIIFALTFHGWAPIVLPILIPAAFLQYLLDSRALQGQPLRASFLGRYNGIAYYFYAGWPVQQHALGLTPIPFDWFIWIGWGLVMTTVISMLDRLVTLLGKPAADTVSHHKADE